MHRLHVAVLAAVALTAFGPPLVALAETPPPSSAPPSPRPPTSPSPPNTPPPSSRASVAPSASSSPAAASAAPSASPTARAASVDEGLERTPGALILEMRRVMAAASLLERIEAQRRLAAAEREFLIGRAKEIRARHEEAVLRVAETRARADERREVLERLLQRAYRVTRTSALEVLLRRGSVVDVVVHLDGLSALSAQERELLDELRALETELARERDELARQEAEIVTLAETVAAKDATLERLERRAERLVAASRIGPAAVSEEEIRVLRALAEEAARETEAADKLIAEIARQAGAQLPVADRWVWPLAGFVTQEFGPSELALEPPRTYKGVAYPRFHEGIDIAAPLGAPVRAAARGRIAFVGHLVGGAMVVVVVHDGGLVTLYGHLDDTVAPPPVRVGDLVDAGERVGAVGLTGITTGPHLHFVVSRADEPIDPRVVLPVEPRQ